MLLLSGILLLSRVCHAWSECGSGCVVPGLIGGQVLLPCLYKEKGPLPLQSARVFWQNARNDVAYYFLDGTLGERYMTHRYSGRTTIPKAELQKGNLSLQMNNINVKDDGKYSCILTVRNKKVHECQIQLQVAAPYQTPVLSASQGDVLDMGLPVNLSCISSGGFPAPVLNWTDDAGRPLPPDTEEKTTVAADPRTGLYNVSSTIRIIAPLGMSVRCSIFNRRTSEHLHSSVWTYSHTNSGSQSDTGYPQYLIALSVSITAVVCVGLIAAIICSHRGRYRGVPTTDTAENPSKTDPSMTELQVI
ncbi:CD276 antigen homolog [Hemiscyllium ocellatum]|uniref:CD276 antigen homolog n=1 Tax=Hemiscyllium ocellatum TaxID=170820 RepID=UPI0029667960|nr:CD276 antigen homolog [Hemiscyllium ocellatum]